MATYILGLERAGYQFWNDIIHYCQSTGHPSEIQLYKQIYDQCFSQILNKMDADFQTFMVNILELPCWGLIHYLETPVNHDLIGPFRDSVRALAIWLYGEFSRKGILLERHCFIFESATTSVLVVNAYLNADYA